MADGIKTYKIVINGITESIDAIDSLNRQLDVLSKKIDELSSKTIKIATSTSPSSSTGGGSNKSSSKSSLTEEEKLERQIAQIDEKREAYSKNIYQNYLAAKDVLKETVNGQKQLAASERLQANTYSNTMEGMKQKLADIKSTMQTVDLGDADKFKQLTEEANRLNEKLKEIEQSYGQFGRNVGNYASAFDSIGKLSVTIGGVTQEFNSAREASRALQNALVTLEAQGKGNTAQAKQLRTEYYKLKSAMDDATKSSRAMDNAMDYMQSFTAMASIGNGLKAFFGFDDNEITKSIQKLVALQGVLQGLETIRKQMETKEGIGKILGEGFEKIDEYAFSLKRLNVSLNGTGAAARVMAAGINVAKVALKGLMSIGLVGAISLAMEGIQKLVTSITNWVKGNADLINSEKLLNAELEKVNVTLERQNTLAAAEQSAGRISTVQKEIEEEKALAEAIQQTNEEIAKRVYQNPANETFAKAYSGDKTWKDFLENDKGTTTLGGWSTAAKDIDELTRRYNALSEAVKHNTGLVYKNEEGIEETHLTASDARDELNHIEQFMAGQLVNTMNQFNLKTKEGREGLSQWVNAILNSNDDLRKSILLRLPDIVDANGGKLDTALGKYLEYIKQFAQKSNTYLKQLKFEEFVNSILDAADETGKRQTERQKKELRERYEQLGEEQQKAEKKNFDAAMKALDDMQTKRGKKVSDGYKKEQKAVDKAEAELKSIKLEQMQDGLRKTIKQLENERDRRLQEAETNGIKVGQLQTEITKLYDKKIEDAKKEHAKNLIKIEEDMWRSILDKQAEYQQNYLDSLNKSIQNSRQKYEDYTGGFIKQGIASYGIQAKSSYTPETQETLGIVSTIKNVEIVDDYKKLIELEREIETTTAEMAIADIENRQADVDAMQKQLGKMKADLAEFNDELKQKYTERNELELASWTYKMLIEENYSKDLSQIFDQRMTAVDFYWKQRIDFEIKENEELAKAEKTLAETRYKQAVDAEDKSWKEQVDKQSEWIIQKKEAIKQQAEEEKWTKEELDRELDNIDKEYYKVGEEAYKAHTDNLKALEEKYNNDVDGIEIDQNNKQKSLKQQYYNDALKEFAKFQTAIANLERKQPIRNEWGFVNWKQTNANNRQLLAAYETLFSRISKKRDELNNDYKDGVIDKEVYETSLLELDAFASALGEKMDKVKQDMSKWTQVQDFAQSAQKYVSAAINSFNDIMNAVWNAQDTQFDKEQEALDKENEMIKNALSKQDEIIEQHKNKVDSIEDELANSRGARRQHLIDQLNAEMEAERRAQKEKERLQKQEELNKKKQDKLDEERKRAEYNRNVLQAAVNGAMAITYAMLNTWPIPAIPMMALAASTTATQLAIMAANKPFKKGGVLEGPSHAQGGIKVYGGYAEVEGHEYIVNKETTLQNEPLLEYINSKHRRIDLSDMIDFYSSTGKVRKNIQGIKTHLADGGSLPALPNSLDIRDQLSNIIINQDNRPLYVTVTDIENKMNDVRYVKTLAGLGE